ncbi:MAG: helicase-associated domain-containing protein [Myxococcota bacterium]|nr:helicase-associated domain-containing protein [Myxococcota bacterium]
MSELKSFFRCLPHAILAQYREIHLATEADGGAALKSALHGIGDAEVAELVEALVGRFGDRRWVRSRLKSMPRTHHVALLTLVQSQGIAGGTWLLQELTQSHGMSEDIWAGVLHELGSQLWVFGNSRQSPPLFYVIPAPIAAELSHQFRSKLGLVGVEDEEIKLSRNTNYRHPVGFSVVSFLAYLRRNVVKVTRKREIFKKNRDEILDFFGNLWGSREEQVLDWHLDVVQELGLVREREGCLVVVDLALGEFLNMTARQRRDLYMAFFRRQERMLIWLMEALAGMDPDAWVPLKKLRALYRRRYMGTVFHRRYVCKSYYLPPSGFYDPSPPLQVLQLAGLLESGLGTKGSYLRLSRTGRIFVAGEELEQLEANASVRFMVQPTFEILAPVGLPLQSLWKLSEIADLKSVDRASTYVLTRESVRRALDEGWRCELLIRFLAENSQVGVPQNVKQTVRTWAGKHGEVEFHDALLVTATAKRVPLVKKVLKAEDIPFEVLGEGIFAVPREERTRLLGLLQDNRLDPAPNVCTYDLADDPTRRRGHLHALLEEEDVDPEDRVADEAIFPTKSLVMLGAPTAEGGKEAMAQRGFRQGRTGANAVGADLSLKPAAAGAGDLLKLSPAKMISVIKAAIRLNLDLEVLYPSTSDTDPGGLSRVTPGTIKEAGGGSFFDGHHHGLDQEMKFQIKRIQGIRLAN